MARQKSEFLGALGRAFEIFKAIADAVLEFGGNDEDLLKVLTVPELRKKLAQFIVGTVSAVQASYKVVVDYGQTLAQMIGAGQYDWTNSDITADNFSVKGEGRQEKEVTLFHFGKEMTSENVLAEMRKAGYRPADLPELLDLGAERKELQKVFPIICLGSVWRYPLGGRGVPCLSWGGRGRSLDLSYFGREWREDCRFAAVRNAS